MSPFINEAGYAVLDLRTKERRRVYKVHRLLMIAFSPIPNYENFHINHIDGNKINNRIENLEWCTAKENNRHARETGLHNRLPGANSAEQLFLHKEYGIYMKSADASFVSGMTRRTFVGHFKNKKNKTKFIRVDRGIGNFSFKKNQMDQNIEAISSLLKMFKSGADKNEIHENFYVTEKQHG
jgi:hypothetical protein